MARAHVQHPNHADSATEERRLTHPSSATAGMVSGTPAVVPVRLSQKRTAGRSLARKDDSDDHDDPFRSDDLGRAFMVLSAATQMPPRHVSQKSGATIRHCIRLLRLALAC